MKQSGLFALLVSFTLTLTIGIAAPSSALAQRKKGAAKHPTPPSSDKLFLPAQIDESIIAELDPARTVKLMDATPDARHWFVVDAFAGWQQIVINGTRIECDYHEIASGATRLSPNGEYVIWAGLFHQYNHKGYDSTITTLYKDQTQIGKYLSDYPIVEFSRSGKRWAALLPYAYEIQPGDRDFVVVDGVLAHKGEVFPHQFSFSHDEQQWGYRATVGLDERLIKSDGTVTTLYSRPASGTAWDPTIWRYTPDVTLLGKSLEGRDYDLKFAHVAHEYKTAYSALAADTARVWVSYNGATHALYRWVREIAIDTAGNHIAYFACDPKVTKTGGDEHRGVVVYDGKIVAGPYNGTSRLFLSPSGTHYAYSLSKSASAFYLDKKVLLKTAQIADCIWSPDESKTAVIAVGEHDKPYVVANGKRSPLYEQIGRIGWTADGAHIEFTAVRNGRVIHVTQAL